MSWKDRAIPAWKKRATPVEPTGPELPEISKGETALRMGAQGGTLGFSDELSGVLPFLHALITDSRIGEEDKGRIMNAVNAYKMVRDDERAANAAAEEANPKTALAAKLISSAGPAVVTGGLTKAAPIVTTAATGGAQSLGESNAEDVLGAAKDTAFGAGTSAALGTLFKIAPALARKLGAGADSMAERATGATGKFAEKNFKPGTGKFLRENKFVRAFDSPAKVAERTKEGMDEAEKIMNSAVMEASDAGGSVSRDRVLNRLRGEMGALKDAKAPVARKLKRIIDDLESGRPIGSGPLNELAEESKAILSDIDALKRQLTQVGPKGAVYDNRAFIGPEVEGKILKQIAEKEKLLDGIAARKDEILKKMDVIPLERAENIKRDFYSQSNYTKPNTTEASKAAGHVLKDEVEEGIASVNPDLADQFIGGKQRWGQLAPVEQAASGRAEQLKHSPIGGLLDTAATGVGELVTGGPVGAVTTAAARRTLAPRIASTTMGALGLGEKALSTKVPGAVQSGISRLPQTLNDDPADEGIPIDQMGKFSGVLQKAKENGKLAITHYVLSQSNPEYQRMLNQGESDE